MWVTPPLLFFISNWPNPILPLSPIQDPESLPVGYQPIVTYLFPELTCSLYLIVKSCYKKFGDGDLDPLKVYTFQLSSALPRNQPQRSNQNIENIYTWDVQYRIIYNGKKLQQPKYTMMGFISKLCCIQNY